MLKSVQHFQLRVSLTPRLYFLVAAVAVMTGDINMTMVTQEIESEEKKTAELVDTLTKRMNKLNVSFVPGSTVNNVFNCYI